jgi:hypothetical protein
MRRALFEWGAMSGMALSLLLFAYWLFSICNRAADFELTSWAGPGIQVSASDGKLMLGNPGMGLEMVSIIESGIAMTPAPTGRHSFVLPGLRLGYMRFADGSIDWYVHSSLLIPAVLLMFVAIFCGRQYWRIRRAALVKVAKTVNKPDSRPSPRHLAALRHEPTMTAWRAASR